MRTLLLLAALAPAVRAQGPVVHDLLIRDGQVLDGAGNPWTRSDVAVRGDRITFVGSAAAARIRARDTVDARGLGVTPGFIDAHSHAELDTPHGRDARLRDQATFEDAHRFSEGAVHVLVNGRFAIRDGRHTGALAGRPLPRASRQAAATSGRAARSMTSPPGATTQPRA